jgi:glycosyltransferase involved in cell wall biosynthesis
MGGPRYIALVHDWLLGMRGGEKVLEQLCQMFPAAPLFTLLRRPGSCSPAIERMRIRSSFLQRMPFALERHQYYLPLYPLAAFSLNLRDVDLVISSSHAAAKAVRVRRGTPHICYCHTPMRYIWDQYADYFSPRRSSLMVRTAVSLCVNGLRRWDVTTAERVTHFIANSRNVQERIRRIYGREAAVIYPPVDVEAFQLSRKHEGYYLIVSALVPYKRIDIAVEAFTRAGEGLLVVGSGQEERKLRSMAGPSVKFLGWVGEAELRSVYEGSRGLIFPGLEDFGIVPVEAMACGKPVLAFNGGGARETVVEGETGTFFAEQSPESLLEALERFRRMPFDPERIRRHALTFSKERFTREMGEFFARYVS